MKSKILYAKGGRALAEAERLFPLAGNMPDGGPDKYLLGVLGNFQKSSFRLVSFGPVDAKLKINDREVSEYGTRPSNAGLLKRRIAYVRGSFRFLIDSVRWKPTIILCGIDGPFAAFALLAARAVGAQYILLVHNALALPSTSHTYKIANRIVTERADKIIVHGPFLKEQALSLGAKGEKIFEFNNGLDSNHRGIIELLNKTEIGTNTAVSTFVFVGRIEEDKGVFDLLDAFNGLADGPSRRLIFVGTGGAADELRRRISKSSAGTMVDFVGHTPHEAIFSLMHKATAVVTPTKSRFPEGRCMVVMEAFFVGTPVIAPDYGPFPYLVEHGVNGLLYSADNVQALRDALREIELTDTGARLREGAKSAGALLMKPQVSFSQAVESAMSSPP